MSVEPAEQLRYTLLPATDPPENFVELHNKTYKFWKNLWQDVFKTLNFQGADLNQDFTRQDIVAVLHTDSEVAAVHLYTFFSLSADASKEHGYFLNNYPEPYQTKLREKGAQKVMTLEYMSVNPAWRKRNKDRKIHIGAILVGLALKIVEAGAADAAIAPARRDFKVNEIPYQFGGDCIAAEVVNHNVSCDLIACFRGRMKPHPDPRINAAIERLWRERRDLTGKTGVNGPHMASMRKIS